MLKKLAFMLIICTVVLTFYWDYDFENFIVNGVVLMILACSSYVLLTHGFVNKQELNQLRKKYSGTQLDEKTKGVIRNKLEHKPTTVLYHYVLMVGLKILVLIAVVMVVLGLYQLI